MGAGSFSVWIIPYYGTWVENSSTNYYCLLSILIACQFKNMFYGPLSFFSFCGCVGLLILNSRYITRDAILHLSLSTNSFSYLLFMSYADTFLTFFYSFFKDKTLELPQVSSIVQRILSTEDKWKTIQEINREGMKDSKKQGNQLF